VIQGESYNRVKLIAYSGFTCFCVNKRTKGERARRTKQEQKVNQNRKRTNREQKVNAGTKGEQSKNRTKGERNESGTLAPSTGIF
jgi:hypothetical protein